MRSPRVIVALSVAALLVVACGTDSKKKVNDPCANNTDCADNICHSGICVSSNALTNGSSCTGKGECKSLNCVGGSCAPGAVPLGGSCLFQEECAPGADAVPCVNGKCGTSTPDGGVVECGALNQPCCGPEKTCNDTGGLTCQNTDGNFICRPKL